MGNQGHSGDGVRLICEWIADGAIGAGPRSPCLDQPARLAAGHRSRAAQGNAARARLAGLGPVDRPGRHAALSSHVSSGHLAGLVGLRHRLAGRPGLPHPRRALLGLEAEVSRPASKAASRPTGRASGRRPSPKNETVPALDDRAFQVPGPGRHAGGQADLVGRRHDAAAARRAGRRPPHGRRRRRRALHRRQGHR